MSIMLKVHKNSTQRQEKDEVMFMLTREQKEAMLNQVLELMTAIAYDKPIENAPADDQGERRTHQRTFRTHRPPACEARQGEIRSHG